MLIIISISCLIRTASVASFKSLIYLTGPAGSVQRFNENFAGIPWQQRGSQRVNFEILCGFAQWIGMRGRERGSLRGGNRLISVLLNVARGVARRHFSRRRNQRSRTIYPINLWVFEIVIRLNAFKEFRGIFFLYDCNS